MRLLVAAVVGLVCLIVLPARSSANLIVQNNSYLSVDSGPPVPADKTDFSGFHNTLEGTSARTSLDIIFVTDAERPFLYGSAQLTSNGGGAVDASTVFDVEFTSDKAQSFAVRGIGMSPGATAHVTFDFGSPFFDLDQSYSSDFLVSSRLAPGAHYHLTAQISDVVGNFTIQVQTPEPSVALLGLTAALVALGLRRAC